MDIVVRPALGAWRLAHGPATVIGLPDGSRPAQPFKRRDERRRTGIEPASRAVRGSPVLKTGGATRHPDASEADVTRARAEPAIRVVAHPARVVLGGAGTGR